MEHENNTGNGNDKDNNKNNNNNNNTVGRVKASLLREKDATIKTLERELKNANEVIHAYRFSNETLLQKVKGVLYLLLLLPHLRIVHILPI